MPTGGAHHVAVIGVAAEQRTFLGADDAVQRQLEQRGQLGEDAFGEVGDGVLRHQFRSRVDDQFQPAPVFGQGMQLIVGTQGGADRGNEPGVGQFGFGAVVIDIVFVDDGQFRRVTRLPGAQDDSAFRHMQFVAEIPHQFEAGLLGLHHDVHQRHGNIRMHAQLHSRLLAIMGMQQAHGPPKNMQVL